VTTITRKAGARAQRHLKLLPLRAAAAKFRAAGRIGTADAIRRQIERLEGAEPEPWLIFSPAEIGQMLDAR
jgi:hypothetical protein